MRDPLSKGKFMSGNREKWCLLFLILGMGILTADVLDPSFDPVPYTQFLLAMGTTFILGHSATDWARSMKVGSLRETEIRETEETKRTLQVIKDDSKPDQQIVLQYQTQFANDPSYAPMSFVKEQETIEDFR